MAATIAVASAAMGADVRSCVVPIREAEARTWVAKQSEPLYTQEAALHRSEGVVVVGVRIDRSGRVKAVVPLEGSSLTLTSAVAGAVLKWRFRPLSDWQELDLAEDEKACLFETKVTYYFLAIGDSKGHVVDPFSPDAAQRYQRKRRANVDVRE